MSELKQDNETRIASFSRNGETIYTPPEGEIVDDFHVLNFGAGIYYMIKLRSGKIQYLNPRTKQVKNEEELKNFILDF
jgi:hypothetical protein